MPKISPINYKKLVKFFKNQGFEFVRQKGDHLIFTKEGLKRPIIIPAYSSVPVFIIKKNLNTAEISREYYLKYFGK